MFVQLKPGVSVGKVEVKNGSVYVGACPGEVVDVNQKQYDLALRSGLFEPAKRPDPTEPQAPEQSEPAEKTERQARRRKKTD